MGERVEDPRGYVATGEGAGLGLLVLSESLSLDPHIQDVCDRLAAEGFTAFAPVGAAAEPEGLVRTVDYLLVHPAVRGHGIGVVGFGRGGGLALWLAGARPDDVRAAVPFYGTAEPRPDWDRITAAVEGHEPDSDGAARADVEEELVSRGKEFRLFLYPGVRDGFFDDSRPDVYDEDAARQAWVRTLEFLRAKLG